ncbi:glucose 1-dehydrogenase [Phyllosticta citrichinensis]|uniref:Glucose 1-dehydrogenase n=1 Tax=Phyllosticta citrichinensis TaxID=1130410 RepID=A0ABR1XWI0_9PEZI
MPNKRVLVGYGIDVDAVAHWINTGGGSAADPTNVSRGVYGAAVGVDRLLKLFDKNGIKATWFVPGHTIESFPEQMAKVRDAGHEIGLHGYTHEAPGQLTAQQQYDTLTKSIDILTKFTGKKPLGYTAPMWFTKPMTTLRASQVVEIPSNWHLDDWPPLQAKPGSPAHGFVDTSVVEKLWMEQFDFAYREHDVFLFPMSIHPQVSGKPQNILMHERIIDYINRHEGVELVTFGQMAT